MSTNKSNHLVNPQAREAMDRFKMEAASQVGVNLTNGYNGELTSRQAGSIGGQMVKKMIEAYENGYEVIIPQKKARRGSLRAFYTCPPMIEWVTQCMYIPQIASSGNAMPFSLLHPDAQNRRLSVMRSYPKPDKRNRYLFPERGTCR